MLALVFLVGLPIVELLLLIQAGSAFGFWPTVGVVIGTALLGLYLIRQQGLSAIRAAQQERASGEIPVGAILNGIRLAFAGILLFIPGFITDAMGFLLLVPGVSSSMIAAAERSGTFRFAEHRTYRARRYGNDGDIVDADYEVVTDPADPNEGQKQDGLRRDTRLPGPDGSGEDPEKGRRNG